MSPHALDSLTVEQPYTLTDLMGACLKVWESVRRSQFSRQRRHNVGVSLHEDLHIESVMTQRLTAQYHNLCALMQTELRTELCREQLWEYLNYFSFKSSLKTSTVFLGAGLQLRCFYILILLFQISMLKDTKISSHPAKLRLLNYERSVLLKITFDMFISHFNCQRL